MDKYEKIEVEKESLELELQIKHEQIAELNHQIIDLEALLETTSNLNTADFEAKIEKALERALTAEEEIIVCQSAHTGFMK